MSMSGKVWKSSEILLHLEPKVSDKDLQGEGAFTFFSNSVGAAEQGISFKDVSRLRIKALF